MLLEKEHDKYNENHNLRTKAEGKMSSIKEVHQKNTNVLNEQRNKGEKSELQIKADTHPDAILQRCTIFNKTNKSVYNRKL